ncbi:MAG: AAA family ATPase [Candidatus Promineifilaceae bacterium]|nr:AAA family ATPase [Candidatus Promineifilaceae bacterium]
MKELDLLAANDRLTSSAQAKTAPLVETVMIDNEIQKFLVLKTLCVGGAFSRVLAEDIPAHDFPHNVLAHHEDFEFRLVPGFEKALDISAKDQEVDLVFLDADYSLLPAMSTFITQLREIRPRLPVVAFSNSVGDTMRLLMRAGAAWHFTKYADAIHNLAEHIHRHVFSPISWEEIFSYYAREEVKPRIEPGLSHADLEGICRDPEEQYIIKRLFANSDVVQIFRMDEGFSGSRIYTVKPRHQLKRILKIGPSDDLEAVQEKQERLIQPRLYRQVGQIRGKVVSAQHLGGACYSLAGSNREAITMTQFLQDQNRVRKELLDRMLEQLQDSLAELYLGNSEIELRYWAPLYSRILPPYLTVEMATLIGDDVDDADYVLDARELGSISAVPSNETLQSIEREVRQSRRPTVILRNFEVAELNSKEGILYLQDCLSELHAADPLLSGKEHPLLRFKIHLHPQQKELLNHPVFRSGKPVTMKGIVCDTQQSKLVRSVEKVVDRAYDYDARSLEIASGRFIPLLENLQYLLWEVGREDMIAPMPIIAPVLHGDLNGGNILVEPSSDVPIWLIDFSDARPGHIYFDIAKLEVEVRTHVFYRLFMEMVNEHIWDDNTAQQFALLVENLLIQKSEETFEDFNAALREHQTEWFDTIYTQFPLYFENLLYFLFSLRRVARLISPERFRRHYAVAVFFQSVTALKFETLDNEPWQPWSKRLALCCAVVHGKEAVAQAKRPKDEMSLLAGLRQRSAQALVTVGQGDARKYLMQWNPHWERFNLVGGRVNNDKGDKDSFARALQRKLAEELGLHSPKDYRIVRERQPIIQQQFSRREQVFKDYEFRLFEIEFLPGHPRDSEEFGRYAQRFLDQYENVLLSRIEIQHLRTATGRPISETVRMILQAIGEVELSNKRDMSTMLDLELDDERPLVNRGRVLVRASLVNARFGNLIENVLVEVLPRPTYAVEPASSVLRISELGAGHEYPMEMWLHPREETAKLTMRVTYYDTRGNEYRQIVEAPIQFRSPVFSLFHMDNPYIVGKPLHAGNESLFVGREDVFTWMLRHLLGEERPRSVILTGPLKMGKTSTLLQITGGVLTQALRDFPQHSLIPVYINLDEVSLQATSEFFAQISQIIARGLRNRGISVPAPSSWPGNSSGFQLFDRYLDEVELSLPHDSLLLIIVDGLDQLRTPIEAGVLDDDLLPYLRSLMQHRSQVSFIFAGTKGLRKEFWQLIVNAGECLELKPLSRRETERLIREPVQPQVRFDELAVEHIWRATMGHPYLTQLICHRLIANTEHKGGRQKIITVDQVQTVLHSILDEDDGYLLTLWNRLGQGEQQFLATLAELQGPGDDTIPYHALIPIEGDPGQDSVLQRLVDLGLVRRHKPNNNGNGDGPGEESFTVAFGLLRRWIGNKRGLLVVNNHFVA